MKSEIIKTRTNNIYLDDDRIIRCQLSSGSEIKAEDIKEDFAVFSKLIGDKNAPVLLDLRGIKSVTREAREYVSSPESMRFMSVLALLIGSPISKVVGNFFLGINKPPYPTKIFTSEAKALAWLKEFTG